MTATAVGGARSAEPVRERDAPVLEANVLEELAASVGGDRGFVVELIDAYLADSATQVDAVEAAAEADDADAIVRPAHTLKSSSATLGARRLSELARAVEMAGRSGSLAGEPARAAASLRAEWERAVAALRSWTTEAGG